MIVTSIREQPKPLPKPPITAVTIELSKSDANLLQEALRHYLALAITNASAFPMGSGARLLFVSNLHEKLSKEVN